MVRDFALVVKHGQVAELRLPEVEPGSSIMPGKVNPSVPEAVQMACFQVAAHDRDELARARHLVLLPELLVHHLTGEIVAEKYGVTRRQQDEFALASHQKAVAAMEACRFKAETVPVEIPGKKGPAVIDKDEGPRKETSLDALAALKPSFEKQGSVTAGNAPGLNDGASALVVTSLAFAKAHGLAPLAKVTAYATGGGEPKDLFFAPIVAVQNLMKKAGTAIGDYDLIEANEAFAVQALADGRALGWDWDRVNVNGGAIALGHPIGASGARVLATLLYAMRDRGKATGLATLCLGGGNAVALSVEAM